MRPSGPCFATPAFRSDVSNSLWYQDITIGDKIAGFKAIESLPDERVKIIQQDLYRSPGDEALFSFFREENSTLLGRRQELVPLLKQAIERYPERPHLRHAIARFIGDQEMAESTAREIDTRWKRIGSKISGHVHNIFISYAHDDHRLVDQLLLHLKPLEPTYGLSIFRSSQIGTGQNWREEMLSQLNRSSVFLMLVSPSYLGSDFIYQEEIPAIRKRAKESGALVIPVILRQCFWQNLVGNLQAVPTSQGRLKPVADWRPTGRGMSISSEQISQGISHWLGLTPKKLDWSSRPAP